MDPVARPRGVQLLRAALVGLALSAVSVVTALWWFQGRLLYPAPHYAERGLSSLPAGLVALRDPASPDSVMGFYRAPLGGSVPRRVWLAFGGNGDLALRFDSWLSPSLTAEQGFLMVEYPGYGARRGEPSPETLLTETERTVEALARHLGTSTAELQARTAVLGYSLGSAAALQYAATHRVTRIVLLSPFTTMLDMARRVVGSPLCHLLAHRYDNVAALASVRQRGLPPTIILHGSADTLIPPHMGRTLAATAPGSRFELVPNAGHQDVLEVGGARLRELLTEP
jgi:uncharacterized protein